MQTKHSDMSKMFLLAYKRMIKYWRKNGERRLKQNWEKRLTREGQRPPRGTSVLGHKSSSYLVCEIFFKEQFWIFFLVWGFFPHWPPCRVPQNFTAHIFFPSKSTGPNHTTRALEDILDCLSVPQTFIHSAFRWQLIPCDRGSPLESTSPAGGCSAGLPCSLPTGAGGRHARPLGRCWTASWGAGG